MSARRAFVVATVLASGALGGALGCDTVELGTPPADVNACRPSQTYFVREIWPNVLEKDYNGRSCADAKCHDPGSGRPLTLVVPQLMIGPTDPIPNPLPEDWAKNYRSAAEQMNCTNVSASTLILQPTSVRHGGGQLFKPTSTEVTSLTTWVTQP